MVSCLTVSCILSPVSWSPVSHGLLSHMVSFLMSPVIPVSCLLSHGSCLKVSCLTSPVPRLLVSSTVSRLLSHVSCLTPPVSCLLPLVSCLTFPVSHLPSHWPAVSFSLLKFFVFVLSIFNLTIQKETFNLNFNVTFVSKFSRKLCECVPFFLRATATAPFSFTFALPQRAPPFLVRASGTMALTVAQVPSTEYCNMCQM